jgi:hypothetical protein
VAANATRWGHYTKDKFSTRRGAVHSIGWLCGRPVCRDLTHDCEDGTTARYDNNTADGWHQRNADSIDWHAATHADERPTGNDGYPRPCGE